MNNYIVTITRQFGSLGRDIGRRISENLQIDYLDRDLIEKTAQQMGVSTSEVTQKDEKMNPYFKMMYPFGGGSALDFNTLFTTQKNIILDYANTRSCVIVGRCSDYVLKDYPNAFHIFIYAPYEARIKNSIEVLGLTPDNAVKMVKSVDKARANYYKYYTGWEMDSIEGKNIMVDSSIMSEDDIVEILTELIKKRFNL